MKQINTSEQAAKTLNIPLPTQNKIVIEPLIKAKKPKRAKRPGEGRPRATLNNLPPAWQSIILKGALHGKFESEIRTEICISKGTKTANIVRMWYTLKEHEAEFRETLNMALIFRKSYFEKLGRKSLKSRYFKEHTWQSIMKNCFGYVDRMEVDHGITDETFEKYKALPVSELQKKLDELMPNRVAGLLT